LNRRAGGERHSGGLTCQAAGIPQLREAVSANSTENILKALDRMSAFLSSRKAA
jgi:hypothetical protein